MNRVINGEGDLYALADGTLITWLRIPNDTTSRAIAFVNIEHDPEAPEPIIWISPGGWSPASPQDIGVTYPCVALGTLQDIVDGQYQLDTLVHDAPPTVHTLDVGGTWPSVRVEALKAAARVWGVVAAAEHKFETNHVIETATMFADWLARDEEPVPEPTPVTRAYLSDHAWFNDGRTRTLFYVIREALTADGKPASQAIQDVIDILDHWTAVTPDTDG